MSADRTAFIVVPFRASMTTTWKAITAVRKTLGVQRVYWHPHPLFNDGQHFTVEVPTATLGDVLHAEQQVRDILQGSGVDLL
jgi:hypothetical protein